MSEQGPLKPYRCFNPACTEALYGIARYDFWSVQSKCPKCGADARDPASSHLVAPLVAIHFDPPGSWGRGQGVYACTGKQFRKEPATGDPGQVTCPLCKETVAWKQSLAAWSYEVITEISDERMVELQAAAAVKVKPKQDTAKSAITPGRR